MAENEDRGRETELHLPKLDYKDLFSKLWLAMTSLEYSSSQTMWRCLHVSHSPQTSVKVEGRDVCS